MNTQSCQEKSNDVNDISIPFDPKTMDLEKEFPELTGWEAIGFHRSIGKELWEFTFEILYTAIWIYTIGLLVPLLYPYPEINGYQGVANTLFYSVFLAFDVGINFPFSRYVAEYRIKDPQKMLEYIRFFIWYQMLTGLVQVTALVTFTLYVIESSEYAYLSWLLLLVVIKQYPGMLSVFHNVLEGNQEFGKSTAITWAQSFLVEYPIKIAAILIGKEFGLAHAELGPLMGMTLGAIIGVYVDDIIFLFVAGYYFAKTIKPFGFSFKDAWIPKVGKDVMVTAFKYGIQATTIPFITSIFSTMTFLWYLAKIPAYVTWRALISIGSGFTGMMGNIGFPLTPAIAESYSNGKKELAEFYVSYYVKWKYFFLILIGAIVAALIPFYRMTLAQYEGLRYYQLAYVFIVPALINQFISPIMGIPGSIFYGAEKINESNIITIIHSILNTSFAYLWLFVFQVQYMGIPGIIFLLCFENIVPNVIVFLIQTYWSNKKIIKIKIYWMSSLILPTLAALPIFLVADYWIGNIFTPLVAIVGFEIALTISLALALGVLLFGTFFPLTGILGVWDDYMLYTFEKALELAGPSKKIFKAAYKMMLRGVNIGKKLKLHGRFGIPWYIPHQQMREQMQIRVAHYKANLKVEDKN